MTTNQIHDEQTAHSNGTLPVNKVTALVSAIQADLENIGDAIQPENLEKIYQLENWTQELQTHLKSDLASATEQHLKHERQWLSNIVSRMHHTTNIDVVLKTVVAEIRQYLQVDRVLVYRFQSQDQGVVIAESIGSGYTPTLGESLSAIAFGASERLDYHQHQIVTVNNNTNSPNYYQLQLLEKFQVKASLSVPILLAEANTSTAENLVATRPLVRLSHSREDLSGTHSYPNGTNLHTRISSRVWGLLVVQQCTSTRQWQEAEISLLNQIITELTLALQREEFRAAMQKQVELAQYLSKAVEKIRQSWHLETIFNTIVKEVRQLLDADRVGIFRFAPHSSFDDGELIAEDVSTS